MDPSKSRNAAALHRRITNLTSDLTNQYRALLARAAEDADPDFSRSAQKELAIKEGAVAIVQAAQNATVLMRELQELWLFGGLDTLREGEGEGEGEEGRKDGLGEVRGIVEEVEGLVRVDVGKSGEREGEGKGEGV